ncbi:hypothetical protein THRCLA_07615 [Thraustotheca clavata]|uniref:Domain of unknown function at the cortex 1 domain-containing protein n=1 Tax=Thraustotheca clavata TaxID=74557 RepID=A0A1V9ZCR3_9STRA|nr:hypothetical protein THRCLA_07615 [Thraustotheca clavata]
MGKQPWQAPSLNIFNLMHPEREQKLPMSANSDEPYEFENNYFRGKILFLLNTDPKAPRFHHLFDGRRRLFWIQLQGQFKQEPNGLVYIGGTVPSKINLGLITTAMCRVILSVLNLLVAGLHYSFGKLYPNDARTKADEELAHICFPLHTSVDEFVCTPEGQVPPSLGQEKFGESEEERAARKASKGHYQFNTRDTYTFSFFSYYIDFEQWQLVHVPSVPNVPLEKFWNNMPLRIVAYSNANGMNMTKKSLHVEKNKQYYMHIELSPSRFREV